VIAVVAALVLTASIELAMGRLPFGPDGKFGWWEGNIWSSEQSQRFADPYSFSHILHGLVFYAFLWIVARKAPARYRFIAAVLMEAGWEITENSPLIINRYRAVTISLGYVGDSIINSLSDVLMMAFGFLIAMRMRIRSSVIFAIVVEIGLLLWVRDSLTLNIVMLVHPVESIKQWQLRGQPR
jgi:hypothetical protein